MNCNRVAAAQIQTKWAGERLSVKKNRGVDAAAGNRDLQLAVPVSHTAEHRPIKGRRNAGMQPQALCVIRQAEHAVHDKADEPGRMPRQMRPAPRAARICIHNLMKRLIQQNVPHLLEDQRFQQLCILYGRCGSRNS